MKQFLSASDDKDMKEYFFNISIVKIIIINLGIIKKLKIHKLSIWLSFCKWWSCNTIS